MRVRTGHVKPG